MQTNRKLSRWKEKEENLFLLWIWELRNLNTYARFGSNSFLYQGLSHLLGLIEGRVVQIQSPWDMVVLNALHHFCQNCSILHK